MDELLVTRGRLAFGEISDDVIALDGDAARLGVEALAGQRERGDAGQDNREQYGTPGRYGLEHGTWLLSL